MVEGLEQFAADILPHVARSQPARRIMPAAE
jgi:hypothetical protein